jgi:hypothetical protein
MRQLFALGLSALGARVPLRANLMTRFLTFLSRLWFSARDVWRALEVQKGHLLLERGRHQIGYVDGALNARINVPVGSG